MKWCQASRWLGVLLLIGCNAKLQVEGGTGGAGANGGGAGDPCSLEYCPPGWGGSGGAPAIPGELGQKCVPATVQTEAEGSPAKTLVNSLDSCADGLTCNSKRVCVPAPDCPQMSGVCVVRRAALGSGGGAGGAQPILGAGGAGSASGASGAGTALPPPPVEPHAGVVCMTGGDTLYWLEYGTRDSLGNYQNDGALWRLGQDAKSHTVATQLHGPVQLGLTASYAYVYLDGGAYIGAQSSPQLIRVPLVGGTAVLVQDGTVAGPFAANDQRAFWIAQSEIFTQDLTTDATSVFLASTANTLVADSEYLYFEANGLRSRAPIGGGPPEMLGGGNDAFTVKDDSLYAIDTVDGAVLSQAPKSSGMFQRIRALGVGRVEDPPQFAQDRYFWNTSLQNGEAAAMELRTGTLANMDPPIVLATRHSYGSLIDSMWVGTADALYWTDGQAIYSRGIPPK